MESISLPPTAHPRPSSAAANLMLGGLTLFTAVMAAVVWRTDAWMGVLFVLVTAMLLLFWIGVLVAARTRRPGVLRLASTRRGLEFREGEAVRRMWLLAPAVGVVVALGTAAALVTTPLALRPVHAVIMGLAAVGSVSLVRGLRAGGRRALVLSPSGIVLDRSDRATLQIPWAEVGRASVGPRGAVLQLAGAPAPLGVDTLGCDPHLLAEVVEFYRTHAALRAELGDARAVQRLRSDAFRTDSAA